MVSSGLICSVLTGLYGYSIWLMNFSFGYSALDHRNVQGSINLICFFYVLCGWHKGLIYDVMETE